MKSPVGIFQFESQYAYDCLKKMSPHAINDMSLTNAALRPSGESYRERLFSKEINHNPSPQIDELLKDNYGYLVFQEDTIRFLQEICGLSGSDADNVRRAIGRKQVDRLHKALPQILEGYCSKSNQPREIAEKEAKEFLQIIEDSSNYQFGYNHSTGYSMIGYMCAYLRYYYPIEFCTALLNNAKNDADLANGTDLIKQLGFELKSPVFRYAKSEYFFDKKNNVIYKGLGSIKHMSAQVAEDLYTLRDEKFSNFIDLLYAIQELPNKPDSRQLDILVKIGYFQEFGNAKALLTGIEVFNKFYKCKTIKVDKFKEMGYNIDDVMPYVGKATEKTLSQLDNKGIILALLKSMKMPKTTAVDMARWQCEYLGYCSISNPNEDPSNWLVLEIKKNNYGTSWAKLWNICYGCAREYRLNKKFATANPVEVGDYIKAVIVEKPKYKKNEDGSFSQVGNEVISEVKCWKKN